MGRCWGQTFSHRPHLTQSDALRPGAVWTTVVRVPVVVDLLRVHGGEEVGDGDVLRTAVRAVAADGAGDEILAVKDLLQRLTAASSRSSSGRKSRMKVMLSSICERLLMPESTISILGKPAAKRMA